MTRDEVIEMAREVWGYLERMPQDLLDAYDAGVAAEREACAKFLTTLKIGKSWAAQRGEKLSTA